MQARTPVHEFNYDEVNDEVGDYYILLLLPC